MAWLANLGCHCTGIDRSAEALAEASLNGVEILERGKARYLGFTGNKVNVVGWTL
jgi:hypothetical protein